MGSRSATSQKTFSVGAELVGIVPHADITWLDPDDDIGTAQGLHVRSTIIWAFLPGHDAQRGLGNAFLDKARLSPNLDRAQWRVRLGNQDGGPGVAPQVPGLDVLLLGHLLIAELSPLIHAAYDATAQMAMRRKKLLNPPPSS